jgi:hypothetical protein
MALTVKSIDEETTELADVYDSLIAPKKIWRNHNNKIYLILRAYAAGKIGLNDVMLALRNRFDPRYCDEADLYSTAKLMGTDFRGGTGSIIRITIQNKDITEQKVFTAGVYNYQSASGTIFSFEVADDYAFAPQEAKIVSAISQEKGSFPVSQNADIKLYRTDNAVINSAFAFSCEDNAGQLGYPDEDSFAFRSRILNDADRQDHIKELEFKIHNLPNIFECNLIINEGVEPVEYDGITLAPKELLVLITGVPTNEIARLVVEDVLYATHLVDPAQVVYYYDEHYVNGRYPVYYKFHDKTNFSLNITYRYDSDKLKVSQVEDAVKTLFKPYTQMVTHIDTFSEEDAYKVLSSLALPNVKILDANIVNDGGVEVAYINIPKTRLAHLTGIVFTAIESGGVL